MRIFTVLVLLTIFPAVATSISAAPITKDIQSTQGATMKQQTRSPKRIKRIKSHRRAARRNAPTIGSEGVLVEDARGSVIAESNQHHTFNPASTLKIATALYSLRRFGPTHPTEVTHGGKTTKAPLIDVIKLMLCYSSNSIAASLGEMIGGPRALRELLIANERIEASQLVVASTSGLGINRITPRAMMTVLRALEDELAKHDLSVLDVFPVAGVDEGTLLKRYEKSIARGSVAAKTGTLIQTDHGASALAGKLRTREGGEIYFVIFHQTGHVPSMRAKQDTIVASVQTRFGGPLTFDYLPRPLLFASQPEGESQPRPYTPESPYPPNRPYTPESSS